MADLIKEMPFGTIFLRGDNIAVIKAANNVNVDANMAYSAIGLMESTFQGNFGFIADNINPYSLEPEVYKIFSQCERLACVAIVSYRKISEQIYLTLEKDIFEKPNKIFTDLGEAIAWEKNYL